MTCETTLKNPTSWDTSRSTSPRALVQTYVIVPSHWLCVHALTPSCEGWRGPGTRLRRVIDALTRIREPLGSMRPCGAQGETTDRLAQPLARLRTHGVWCVTESRAEIAHPPGPEGRQWSRMKHPVADATMSASEVCRNLHRHIRAHILCKHEST